MLEQGPRSCDSTLRISSESSLQNHEMLQCWSLNLELASFSPENQTLRTKAFNMIGTESKAGYTAQNPNKEQPAGH